MSDLPPPGFLPPAPPSGVPPYAPPPAAPPAPAKKPKTWVWVIGAFVVGLLLGVAVGAAGSSSDGDETAAKSDVGTEAADEPTTTDRPTTTVEETTTTEAPTTTTAPPYTPKPEDFQIGIVETERSCYGSAGCNITYRIDVKYTGQLADPDATYTVVYEVRGGEDVEKKNFTVADGQISYHEDMISTGPNPSLSAVPVQVLVD